MNLPEEPMMLYSFINMKLRDSYPTLDALCAVGFEYNPDKNRFW